MAALRWWQHASAVAILALAASAPPGRAEPPNEAGSSPSTPVQPADPAPPGDDSAPSNPVRRTAAAFDFEEPDNPYPVPRLWARAQDAERAPRPGFPRFNQAEFDFGVAHSGGASVKLPTKGGSTSLRLSPGVIPVFADGDYAVSAWVRTDKLEHARAFVRARFLTQNSQPLPETEVVTPPLQTHGEWAEIGLQLIGAPPAAAYLQVELQLLQPQVYEPGDAPGEQAPFRVRHEDLGGAAWFDDVVVDQLPRVEITTGAGANIVVQPDHPVVHILVRDFVGEHLDGRLVVTDIDDREICDVQTPLATTGRSQEWTPQLPALGWYRVTLSVYGDKPGGGKYRVGGSEMTFLWLAGDDAGALLAQGPRTDRHRFGIAADRVEPDLRTSLPSVGNAIGTGFMTIPLWSDGVRREDIPSSVPELGRMVDQLSRAGQEVVVCVPFVPAEVQSDGKIDPADPLALAGIEPDRWMPFLQPLLDRYGQRLTRWQIGRTGTDGAFWHTDLVAAAEKFGAQLATLVPGPRVGIPWRAEYELPDGVPGGGGGSGRGVESLSVAFPAAFDSAYLKDFTRDLIARSARASPAPELTIVPELDSGDVCGERASVTELGRRTVEFWAARTAPGNAEFPVGIAVSHPWRRMGERRSQMMPAASLGAFRTLIDHLSERLVIGEYKIAAGVKCYILADRTPGPDGRVGGALVAWNETAAPEDAVIRRYLGDGRIEAVDLFGNRTPVTRSDAPGSPHILSVGETPVFIEGADPMLASFCAQVRPEPAFLPSVQTEHELTLVLSNPWPRAISGKLQILPPDADGAGGDRRRRWSITPDGIVPFSLGAGQSKRIPWTVAFPFFEETGEKRFSVAVQAATDHELPPILLPMALQVGLQDLDLDPEVQLGPRLDGPDVIIMATVLNRGDRSRMLKLEAVAAGYPTQQSLIADLPAGESVIKRIVLKNAAARLTGQRVHLSLSDSEEQQRLITSVLVP
jgi:hypothetical protein